MTEPHGGGGTINLPGIGPTKKTYVIVAGAGVALVAAYAYYRYAQSGTSAATDPTYAVDPATGSATGSDAYAGANDSVSGSAGSASYDNTPKVATTDQEWTANVTDALSYLEPSYLLDVLGKYLDRKPLTTEEAGVIRSAWAAEGHPPGNQPIVLATDGSSSGTVTVPDVPGIPTVGNRTQTSVTLSWPAVPNATKYRVYGPDTAVRETTGTTQAIASLAMGQSYTFSVSAVNAAGESNKSASVIATTLTTTTPAPPAKPTTPTTKPTTAKPAAATYASVKVVKFTTKSPPWNSTISGIAGHYHTTTSAVWNDPKNAALKKKRGAENNIQPGDTVYVKTK